MCRFSICPEPYWEQFTSWWRSTSWSSPCPSCRHRWLLNRIELFYLGAYFLASALALHYAYIRATDPVLKHQLKWVTRGTWVAIVPFVAIYALPYFLGFVPNSWMNASALSLAFLPFTFGYAIVRYRLMDVDIIFRRGISYTLATAGIVGLYFALIALFADFFRATFPPINSRGAWVVAIVFTAVAVSTRGELHPAVGGPLLQS